MQRWRNYRLGETNLPLKPGDRWVGLDTLRVIDTTTGKIVLDGLILTDMDINPEQNRVTMMVSSDISNGND